MGQTTGAGASCVGVEQTLPIIKSELTTRGGSRQPSKRHDFKHQAHRPLDGLTTFGTRSEADHYAEAGSLDELEAHLAEANANGLPVHFLARAPNTIAMSRVPGMTIRHRSRAWRCPPLPTATCSSSAARAGLRRHRGTHPQGERRRPSRNLSRHSGHDWAEPSCRTSAPTASRAR